jgi:hypothetical protein
LSRIFCQTGPFFWFNGFFIILRKTRLAARPESAKGVPLPGQQEIGNDYGQAGPETQALAAPPVSCGFGLLPVAGRVGALE